LLSHINFFAVRTYFFAVRTLPKFCHGSLTWVRFDFSMGWLKVSKGPRSPTAFD
jgi:hypothetical protein